MKNLLQTAIEHHRAGRLAQAEPIYRQILALSPAHPEALHLLGMIAHQTGHADAAIAFINQAIAVKPNFAEAYCNLGAVHFGQGRLEESAAFSRKAIAIKPNYLDAHNNLAAALIGLNKFDDAAASAQRAIAIKRGSAEAHNNLGYAYLKQNKPGDAVASLRRAIAIRQDYPEALRNLGDALANQGKFGESVVHYQKALSIRPAYAEAMVNLGVALTKAGRIDDAIALYRQAIAIRPNYPEAFFNLGVALFDQVKLDEAIACYRKAIALDPDYINAHRNLGFTLHRQGAFEESASCYRRVIAIEPDNQSALHMIAAMAGSNPERASTRYVAGLFDEYAEKFDAHLVQELEYRSPGLIVSMIRDSPPATGGKWDVLDLGCGTGLAGAAIAPYARHLVGVDLSPRMLDKARERGVYTRLEAADLLEMTRGEAAETYDAVTAADVFVYIGKLDALFAEVKRLLRAGGRFGFTLETLKLPGDAEAGAGALQDYRLTPTGRYAHSSAYIERLAAQSGFKVDQFVSTILRLELGKPVNGWLVLLSA
jgi:predicted TPR repeat methyltransferase